MSRLMKDFLCGMVGYSIGKRNREFTQEEVDELIHSFLQSVPLDAVIDFWMDANGYFAQSERVADTLRRKADEVDYHFIKD